MPDEAVNDCERSYEAANGDKKTATSTARYDDQGWMSLICRHDIPLFFANIDTPGEQQKYAIALILWLYKFLPPTATTFVLYDIGCVLDRSSELVCLLHICFYRSSLPAYNSMTFFHHRSEAGFNLRQLQCTHLAINGHAN